MHKICNSIAISGNCGNPEIPLGWLRICFISRRQNFSKLSVEIRLDKGKYRV